MGKIETTTGDVDQGERPLPDDELATVSGGFGFVERGVGNLPASDPSTGAAKRLSASDPTTGTTY